MNRNLTRYTFTLWLLATAFFFTACAPVVVVEEAADVTATRGMVASAHPLASQVGVDILSDGGNAVDAAVAVAFALGVVEPNASGVGGGGLMLIRFAGSGEVVYIDSREKAPAAAHEHMFELDDQGRPKRDARGFNPAIVGGKAVAVPGDVAGLLTAQEKYGSMNRQQVIQPAIDRIEAGLPVSSVLAKMITDQYDVLAAFPASENVYMTDGFPKEVGETVSNTDLANTLQLIAEQGRDGFYQGPVAQDIVAAVQADGGIMTLEDLAAYQPTFREPVRGSYRGYEIISAAPPSSGGAHVIELLNIMENFKLRKMGFNTPETIHAWAEAMKLVYADRAKYMADTDFTSVPVQGLISKQYAREQFKRIDMSSAMEQADAGDPWPSESGSTTHFSVVDGDGNMVAYTKTIGHFFASGITGPESGILLNDQMDDFDKRPGQANSIEGGKKPLSSMTPTLILKDGKPFATIGSPGGKRIISTVAFLISNLVDYDMGIQTAINAPRFNNYENGALKIEGRIPLEVREALEQKGHELSIRKDFDLYFGGAQGIIFDQDSGVMHGGADPRRDGKAIGY